MTSHTGTIRIALLVIIVALVAALVYVVAVPKSERNGSPSPPAPSPALQDETAGWKTYRNEEYGFEFTFPSNVKVIADNLVSEPSGAELMTLGVIVTRFSQVPKATQEAYLASAEAIANTDGATVKTKLYGDRDLIIEFIPFAGGKSALSVSRSYQAAKPYYIEGSIFDKHNNWIRITPLNAGFDTKEDAKSSEEFKVLNQILSTFKFTQ